MSEIYPGTYRLESTPDVILLLDRMPIDELVELSNLLEEQGNRICLDILRVNAQIEIKLGMGSAPPPTQA